MPLTFAHPAAVVPLVKPLGRFGILSALVCGSVSPDLPYFAGSVFEPHETHRIGGLFWFCLPAGVICYAVYHYLLKHPLLDLAPIAVASRMSYGGAIPPASVRHWLAVVICVFVGAITHVVWDSFTHYGGAVVAALPVLERHLLTVGGYRVYGYKILQHGSTIAGLVYLAWTGYRSYHRLEFVACRAGKIPRTGRMIIIAVLVAAAIVVAATSGFAAVADGTSKVESLRLFLGRSVVVGTSVLVGGLLVFSLLWHAFLPGRGRVD